MSPRLPTLKPIEIVRALERDGRRRDRQRGSHLILKKPGHEALVSVVMHSRDMKRGTVLNILSQAELSQERFLELLRG